MDYKFATKLCIVFALALFADILASLHIKYLVDNSVFIAVSTIFFLHQLTFLETLWFVDSKTATRRYLLTLSASFGAMIGCWIVIVFM